MAREPGRIGLRRIRPVAHFPSSAMPVRVSMHTTSVSLLVKLRDPGDHLAWERFVQIYTPLMRSWLLRQRVQPHDLDDLLQTLMVKLVQKLPEFEYDPSKSFRSWLRRILQNDFVQMLRERREIALGGDGTDDSAHGAWGDRAVEPEDFWAQEYARMVVTQALPIMREHFAEKTWRACWMTTVEDRSAAEVAAELGLSVGSVHVAKHRVLQRLREELAGLLD